MGSFSEIKNVSVTVIFLTVFSSSFSSARTQKFQTETDRLYASALQAIEEKNYSSAEQYLRRLLSLDRFFQEKTGKSGWYQLGLVLEREEEPYQAIETMEQGLDTLSRAGLHDWYLTYDLARLYAENQVENPAVGISDLVYQTVRHVSPQKQPDLWQRIIHSTSLLLSDSQQVALEQKIIGDSTELGQFLYSLFRRIDPNPITEQNESFAILFQRQAEAKRRFPDRNAKSGYDSRGELYIRLGKPWKIYYDHSGLLGEIGYAIQPYEIWLYTKIHPELYFTFVRKRGVGSYERVDGIEAIFGANYRDRRTIFDKQPAGYTAFNLHFRLYEELAPLHRTFKDRLEQLLEQYSPEEAVQYARIHFTSDDHQHAEKVKSLLKKVSFNPEGYYETLPLDVSITRFQSSGQTVRTEIAFGIANEALFFQVENDEVATELFGDIGIFDSDFSLIKSDSLHYHYVIPSREETKMGGFVGTWVVKLPPANYYLYFTMENPNSLKRVVYRDNISISPFPSDSLSMSDVQLATNLFPSSEPSEFVKHGLFVIPAPGNTIQKDSVFVYFEIYNLHQSDLGKTHYTVEYRLLLPKEKGGFFSKMTRIFGRKKSLAAFTLGREEKSGVKQTETVAKGFDLSKYNRGTFEFEIVVNDLNSGDSVSRKVSLQVLK